MTSRVGRELAEKFDQIGMEPETGYVIWKCDRGPWERLPVEVAQNYEFVKTRWQGCMYFNEQGLVHRVGGHALGHEKGVKEWWVEGKCHRVDGPAVEFPPGRGVNEWWVNNVKTDHPGLCEKATQPDLTDEEFYHLCSHKDYVVRKIAMHNPNCPNGWRILVELMNN